MNLDWKVLLAKTDIEHQECIVKMLDSMKITTYAQLQNLPGRYGQPFLCQVGTHLIVAALNKAIAAEDESVPSIDEVVQEVEPEEIVTQETLLSALDLPGVSDQTIDKLIAGGVLTVNDVLKDDGEHLTEVSGIGETTRDRVVRAVKAALELKE